MKKSLIISILVNIVFVTIMYLAINKLGGMNYLILKLMVPNTAKYQHRSSQFEMLPRNESPIIFIGNSLIAEGNWNELLSVNCLNRGIGGDDSQGIYDRIDEIIRLKPEKIFIMSGINDLGQKRSISSILFNYKKIISKINLNSPNTELFVQSVLPVNNEIRDTKRSNESIKELNEKLNMLTKSFNCSFIDLHSLFIDKNGNLSSDYSLDGIHLNGSGYFVWAKEIETIIK